MANEFHVTEGGRFVTRTLQEMTSDEFQAFVTAACTAYKADCSSGTETIRKAEGKPYGRPGSDAFITAQVTQHDPGSEEWRGIYRAPSGYSICDAKLYYRATTITDQSTFNTAIVRNETDDGLGFYAVIPKKQTYKSVGPCIFVIK